MANCPSAVEFRWLPAPSGALRGPPGTLRGPRRLGTGLLATHDFGHPLQKALAAFSDLIHPYWAAWPKDPRKASGEKPKSRAKRIENRKTIIRAMNNYNGVAGNEVKTMFSREGPEGEYVQDLVAPCSYPLTFCKNGL